MLFTKTHLPAAIAGLFLSLLLLLSSSTALAAPLDQVIQDAAADAATPGIPETGIIATTAAAVVSAADDDYLVVTPVDNNNTTSSSSSSVPPEGVRQQLGERGSLSPHMNCYSGGQTLSAIGSMDSRVEDACAEFSQYSGHTFVPGSTVQWCTSVPAGNSGLVNNFVLMMRYKGEAASFTPLASNYQGGLREYCHTAMQWVLQNCDHGGVFQNHKIGAAGVGFQYWDAKVDPNTGSCQENTKQ